MTFASVEAFLVEEEIVIFVRVERRVEVDKVDKVLTQLVSYDVEIVTEVETAKGFVQDSGIQHMDPKSRYHRSTQSRVGQMHLVFAEYSILTPILPLQATCVARCDGA